MTPEEIGTQQVWAAWISAGAAWVQAIGAGAAIFYTVKLARDAQKKADDAEKASVERQRAAEAASVARAERAEQVAAEREAQHRQQEKNDEHNQIIQTATAIAKQMTLKLEDDIATFEGHVASGSLSSYGHGIDRKPYEQFKELLPSLQAKSTEEDLVLALSKLEDAMGSHGNLGFNQAGELVGILRRLHGRITQAVDDLNALKRE